MFSFIDATKVEYKKKLCNFSFYNLLMFFFFFSFVAC